MCVCVGGKVKKGKGRGGDRRREEGKAVEGREGRESREQKGIEWERKGRGGGGEGREEKGRREEGRKEKERGGEGREGEWKGRGGMLCVCRSHSFTVGVGL